MTTVPADPAPPALVVTGMHRSGTSFLASLLHRSGCHMGEELLAADANNRPGYFEDLGFLDLDIRMLATAVPVDIPGNPELGWTDHMGDSGIPVDLLRDFIAEADALIARRRSQAAGDPVAGRAGAACWGWKDPRTAVLLDFWNARLPDARYMFIYRSPWDVVASMQRTGIAVFHRNPEFAYRIWQDYNRALLAFAEAHRDRTLLVSATAVMRDPRALLDLVESHFGIRLDRDGCDDVVDAALMVSADTRLAVLGAAAEPESTELYRELEAAADLPSGQALPPALAAPSDTEDPQLSIIIACSDDGPLLLEAIASVESAVSVPYELIVVGDGSAQSRTVRSLACLGAGGYRVIEPDDHGPAAALNRAIREARSSLYLPLRASDRLRPGFVEAALDLLAAAPAVMAVYGDRREFGLQAGRVTVGVPDLNRLLCGDYIGACAVIRHEAWLACGGYDERASGRGTEIWDFWLSMLERDFRLHRLDMETIEARVRSDLFDAMSADERAAGEAHVLAKHAPLYLTQLRRQVANLDSSAQRVAELEAQLRGPRRPHTPDA